MSNPVILYGTAEDGTTLPVQVDATGRLVAQGLPGPEGPEGPPGVGELPPDPQNGQVLGWQDGQLAWVDASGGGFFFYLDLLIVAGGGTYATGDRDSSSGGGAGGFFQTRAGQMNPGDVAAPGAFKVSINPLSPYDFSASVGLAGRDSSFIGGDLNLVMKAGGDGGNRNHGGCGGGGGSAPPGSMVPSLAGQGTEGQGNNGADGRAGQFPECTQSNYTCNDYCVSRGGGGGGGAGGPGVQFAGGPGLPSDITGTSLTYCVGGNGESICSSHPKPPADGQGMWGSGGSRNSPPGEGLLVLRYPDFLELTIPSGAFTRSDESLTNESITSLSNGSGNIKFSIKPEVVMSTIIDYLKRERD